MKRIGSSLLVLALLGTLTVGLPSCHPRMARLAAAGLIFGAAVAVVASHQAPPPEREPDIIIEGRDVYHYEGRWMYYDEEAGQWYYYVEEPVEVEEHHYHHHYYHRNNQRDYR